MSELGLIKIVLLGRGGMGIVTACEIIAEAAYLSGNFIDVQAYPSFGAERRGAPVQAYVKLSRTEKVYDNFESHYIVYKDLRDKGYVVTPGIKFGSDFAVYERGPGIDHAPFIISVKSQMDSMGPFEIVRAGRLATTVRKQFIISHPKNKKGDIDYLIFSWFRA